ncbi:MAG: four helix bundle protein [Flavobacteriales bacterium]|nr:four helix bundle protein [Flavobacteriales bacterium]MCB9449283.1 four helix bundle protein [Flavobacteriales bacterium]
MEKVSSYTDLEVWKISRSLVSDIYELTTGFPSSEMFGITNQMRRCVVSIPSNIAEGCGRQQPKDCMRFFSIARGSLYELETQLYLSLDLKFISSQSLVSTMNKVITCKRLLNGFINYYHRLANNQ